MSRVENLDLGALKSRLILALMGEELPAVTVPVLPAGTKAPVAAS